MAYEPPFYAICTVSIGGVGGLQDIDKHLIFKGKVQCEVSHTLAHAI